MNFLRYIITRPFGWFFDKVSGASNVIKDFILSINNLTKAVIDLSKSQVLMAKMQQEDRKAITDLYNAFNDLINELAVHEFERSATVKPNDAEYSFNMDEELTPVKKKSDLN